MHQMIGHPRSVDHANDAMLGRVLEPTCHVLGGALLHRGIPWQHGTRYGKRTQSYADFTIRFYGSATTVVFDGYEEGPSIKYDTHQRHRCQHYRFRAWTHAFQRHHAFPLFLRISRWKKKCSMRSAQSQVELKRLGNQLPVLGKANSLCEVGNKILSLQPGTSMILKRAYFVIQNHH